MYLRIIESKKRPETENIEILDALKIDNITKLKQISPFLGEMDLAQSDDVTGSKVQLLWNYGADYGITGLIMELRGL